MNHSFRLLFSLFLVSLLPFMAGWESRSVLPSASSSDNEQREFASIKSPNLFCPPTKTENILDGPGSSSSSLLKDHPDDFWLFRQMLEARAACRISERISRTRTFLYSLKSTDIIFPFHFFW